MFGDGEFGANPEKRRGDPRDLPRRGRAAGNVAGRTTIQTIAGAPQLALLGAKVTNPARPTGGGSDRRASSDAVGTRRRCSAR